MAGVWTMVKVEIKDGVVYFSHERHQNTFLYSHDKERNKIAITIPLLFVLPKFCALHYVGWLKNHANMPTPGLVSV